MEEARTLVDVERIMGFAKLDRSELQPTVQCLKFKDELANDSIRLMEVDQKILDALENGERVVLRGHKTDSAVLCTNSSTYLVRDAETSNELLILEDLDFSEDIKDITDITLRHKAVCAIKQDYLEAVPIQPKLNRLKELLNKNLFSGMECEDDQEHQGEKYTQDDIMSQVQASETEIEKALENMGAVTINGHWRLLDFDYKARLLDSILALVEEHSWTLDSVPLWRTCDLLEDMYPRSVTQHLLIHFSDDQAATDSSEKEQTYRISEDKVCRHFAEFLLRLSRSFKLDDFEKSWQLTVPDGMKTGLDQIEGLALIDHDSSPQVIKYFPASELPEDISDRFDVLFGTNTYWSLEQITPFLRDIATAKVGVGALLLKYSRGSTRNGIKMYSSKKIVK